ncbi:MAG: hypothetical protein LBQ84_04165 [Flavobacteriaceae bacterium]|jgi:16S rRNA A1518/A1519 N6-dimethyltransferase RsmA/KsgA/DIM1 with predicted DNA glycosylase/AP lyase activity|nr:hypothetical protein [Flavobacteriaceae bacterium]
MNNLIQKIKSVKRKYLPSRKEKKELAKIFEKRVNMYKQFVSPNDLCFDVGSNMGNRVEPLLHINAKIIAIEPQKKCQTYLRKKFKNKITLVSKGLGEKEDEKIFYISNASTLSSFSSEWIRLWKNVFVSILWTINGRLNK